MRYDFWSSYRNRLRASLKWERLTVREYSCLALTFHLAKSLWKKVNRLSARESPLSIYRNTTRDGDTYRVAMQSVHDRWVESERYFAWTLQNFASSSTVMSTRRSAALVSNSGRATRRPAFRRLWQMRSIAICSSCLVSLNGTPLLEPAANGLGRAA